MYARAVDDAATRLRDLRHEEWEDLGLAGIALGLAIAATEVRPALALPLFVGGLAAWALGIRALWRRWDLVDRLAGERDAYVIPEVRKYALRETSMERRRGLAAYVRRALQESSLAHEARVTAVADELERSRPNSRTKSSPSIRRAPSPAHDCSATWPRARS